ncbi:hypothetical protein [Kitasatospora aureofaciens]|uniref:hypothetical protein n=1 Tax=Kitasatospora aureofaciens TaxID=1894 RepID=UPI0038266774
MGELVKDRRTGRLGTYMDMRGGEAYLRPPEGGTEWTTNPASIERYGDESRVVVNIIPDRRYPVPGAGSADAA